MSPFLIIRPSIHPLVAQAALDAEKAHNGQMRKSGLPYWTHCREVAELLVRVGIEDPEMLAAAYLHDTLEDTTMPADYIQSEYGERVMGLVEELTEAEYPGNRAARKKLSAEFLWSVGGDTQTIKCADLISNTSTIVEVQKDFAKIYLPEKRYVLQGLTRADPVIRAWAYRSLEQAEAALVA